MIKVRSYLRDNITWVKPYTRKESHRQQVMNAIKRETTRYWAVQDLVYIFACLSILGFTWTNVKDAFKAPVVPIKREYMTNVVYIPIKTVKAQEKVVVTPFLTPTPTPILTVDQYIDKYSKMYAKNDYEADAIKVKLHFLLFREARYGKSTACGDGGLACGPLQYHLATYKSYRQQMLDAGLIKEIGSRLNLIDSIQTTAWALSKGKDLAWGPLARAEIKL